MAEHMANRQAPWAHSLILHALKGLQYPLLVPSLYQVWLHPKFQFAVAGLLNRPTASGDSSTLLPAPVLTRDCSVYEDIPSFGAVSNDSIPLVPVWGQEAVCHTLGPALGSRCQQF